MKLVKIMVIAAFSFCMAVGCSSGPSYDDCLAKAKETFAKNGVPTESQTMMAEQSCAACKENKDACKPIIDALK